MQISNNVCLRMPKANGHLKGEKTFYKSLREGVLLKKKRIFLEGGGGGGAGGGGSVMEILDRMPFGATSQR